MKLTFETKNHKITIGGHKWRVHKERYVTDYQVWFGPFRYKRDNLSFDRDAAGRMFDKLNDPDRPLRKLADLYTKRG